MFEGIAGIADHVFQWPDSNERKDALMLFILGAWSWKFGPKYLAAEQAHQMATLLLGFAATMLLTNSIQAEAFMMWFLGTLAYVGWTKNQWYLLSGATVLKVAIFWFLILP